MDHENDSSSPQPPSIHQNVIANHNNDNDVDDDDDDIDNRENDDSESPSPPPTLLPRHRTLTHPQLSMDLSHEDVEHRIPANLIQDPSNIEQ